MQKLIELIQSMSKSEKRYFKLQARLQRGNKNYLELMDAVSKEGLQSDEELMARFEGRTFIKHFAVAKRDLYELLLKSLRQYHSRQSTRAELNELLQNIELLYRRGLYAHNRSLIRKGLRLAKAAEEPLYEVLFLQWKQRHLQTHQQQLSEEEVQQLSLALSKRLERYLLENTYWKLSTLAFLRYEQYRKSGKPAHLAHWEDLLQHPLLQKEEEAQTFGSQLLFYHTRLFVNSTAQDLPKMRYYSQKMLDLFEAAPLALQESMESYIIVLNNHIQLLLRSKAYEEAVLALEKLRSIPERYKKQRSSGTKLLVHKHWRKLQLDLAIRSGRLQNFPADFEPLLHFMEQQAEAIGEHTLLRLCSLGAYLAFILEDYENAQSFAFQALQRIGAEWRQDTFHINLIYLLVHDQLEHFSLEERLARQLYRLLRQKATPTAFEAILARLVRRLPLSRLSTDREQLYRQTLADLEALPEDLQSARFQHFNLAYWLRSQLQNCSFRSLLWS